MTWQLFFYGIVIMTVGCILEVIRELNTFQVTHYHIRSPRFRNYLGEHKVAVISDLHNHTYGKQNKKLIMAVRSQHPELILITGDILTGKAGHSFEVAQRFVCELTKICPVYYALGNHEQRMRDQTEFYGDGYRHYREALIRQGVHFLENASVQVQIEGQIWDIHGLEVPLTYYKKSHCELTKQEVEERIGRANPDHYQIVLVHQPQQIQVCKEWGADMTVSGHFHGGLVRLPFVGGLITPQAGLFPRYSGGHYKEEGMDIVVSKGLGMHTIPLRFGNPAEVVVLHLKGLCKS